MVPAFLSDPLEETKIFTGSPNAITVSNGKKRRDKNDFNALRIK
jgi:hypothetical protein